MNSMNSTIQKLSEEKLQESYRHCEYVAKTQARNFYFSFVTLPPDKKAAMCAIYAFMRYSDDVSDEAAINTSKAEEMQAWRKALTNALNGEYADNLILPAFHDTVMKYKIPESYFHELIDGTEMDLTINRYATWEELRVYCYRVACLVGFVCIHVWGFDPAEGKALEYSEACGLAFQLTNILRDIKEDHERNRIYLPADEMQQFKVSEDMLGASQVTTELRELIKYEVHRAELLYEDAWKLMPLLHKDGQSTLRIMIEIYYGILSEIKRSDYEILNKRASVPTVKKLGLVAKAWVRSRMR